MVGSRFDEPLAFFESNEVLLIAGGVGITPLMSIVRYLTDRSWNGDIYFLVVARSEQDLIFKDELALLQERFNRLHVCTNLTRSKPGDDWRGEQRRASESLFKKLMPNYINTPVYLCGPNEMMSTTRTMLLGAGVAESLIHTEAFVSPAETNQVETTAPTVSSLDQVLSSGEGETKRKYAPRIFNWAVLIWIVTSWAF